MLDHFALNEWKHKATAQGPKMIMNNPLYQYVSVTDRHTYYIMGFINLMSGMKLSLYNYQQSSCVYDNTEKLTETEHK